MTQARGRGRFGRWVLIGGLASLFLVAGRLDTAGRALATSAEDQWHQWRGPLATGVAPRATPPLTWSESENLRWKVEVPGHGHASPVVWGELVFVLTAVARAEAMPTESTAAGGSRRRNVAPAGPMRFEVLALDRRTGEVVWRRTAREEEPHEGTHPDGTWASGSAVIDGARLYAHFGSRGLYAYDLEGSLAWQKDFGDMETRLGFGEGSSPAIWGRTLVVNWDHEGQSFIVALDARTGDELWRRNRDEVTSWATPLAVEHQGRRQVIVNATRRVRSYDLETGEELWEVGGMTVNTIPSPVYGRGLVYATSGFRGNALLAIRLDGAKGDLTGSGAVVWSHDRDTPYVPSPLLYEDSLYILKSNSGVLTRLDARTGKIHYGPVRLPGIEGVFASPVAADGRVYITGRNGTTLVLRHGPELEILAENHLDEAFNASPALVGDEIFLRGRQHLYCIGEER